MKRRLLIILGVLILVSLLTAIIFRQKAAAPENKKVTQTTKADIKETPPATTAPQAKPVPAFNKQAYSQTDPNSIWVIVNKKRPLPDGYIPSAISSSGLRVEASNALQSLRADSAKQGAALSILSAYRSQATQASTYGAYVAKDGAAKADTYSARPRHSEHQTGLAVDVGNGVCNLELCFGNTNAGKWLANNAHVYGFVIRYPASKESITGYQYEPWHLRYVGKELASEIFKSKQTLEEFFGLPAAPSY